MVHSNSLLSLSTLLTAFPVGWKTTEACGESWISRLEVYCKFYACKNYCAFMMIITHDCVGDILVHLVCITRCRIQNATHFFIFFISQHRPSPCLCSVTLRQSLQMILHAIHETDMGVAMLGESLRMVFDFSSASNFGMEKNNLYLSWRTTQTCSATIDGRKSWIQNSSRVLGLKKKIKRSAYLNTQPLNVH